MKSILKYKLLPFGSIEVFKDRVTIYGILGINSKTFLFKQIAHLSVNRVTQRLRIETTGGGREEVTVAGSAEVVKQTIEQYL
jgi:hypothetical protein